jgi:hypothetical protein
MAGEHYRHIFLAGPNRTQQFTNPRGGGLAPAIPPRDRAGHSKFLCQQIKNAWRDCDNRQAVVHVERQGAYIDFVSEPGFELVIKSMENRTIPPIRLLNLRQEGPVGAEASMAMVHVPYQKRGHFSSASLGQRYGWGPKPHHFRYDADWCYQEQEPRSIADHLTIAIRPLIGANHVC